MDIRDAEIADSGSLIRLGWRMHGEVGAGQPEPDADHINHILSVYRDSGILCVKVAIDDDICGFLCGAVVPKIFSKSLTGVSELIYLVPECRTFANVRALIRAFEAWSKDRGAVRIAIATGTRIDYRPLFARLGYEMIGHCFRKDFAHDRR